MFRSNRPLGYPPESPSLPTGAHTPVQSCGTAPHRDEENETQWGKVVRLLRVRGELGRGGGGGWQAHRLRQEVGERRLRRWWVQGGGALLQPALQQAGATMQQRPLPGPLRPLPLQRLLLATPRLLQQRWTGGHERRPGQPSSTAYHMALDDRVVSHGVTCLLDGSFA